MPSSLDDTRLELQDIIHSATTENIEDITPNPNPAISVTPFSHPQIASAAHAIEDTKSQETVGGTCSCTYVVFDVYSSCFDRLCNRIRSLVAFACGRDHRTSYLESQRQLGLIATAANTIPVELLPWSRPPWILKISIPHGREALLP